MEGGVCCKDGFGQGHPARFGDIFTKPSLALASNLVDAGLKVNLTQSFEVKGEPKIAPREPHNPGREFTKNIWQVDVVATDREDLSLAKVCNEAGGLSEEIKDCRHCVQFCLAWAGKDTIIISVKRGLEGGVPSFDRQ
jgi:hypothetical protein